MDVVAQLKLVGVRHSGERFPVLAQIGRPYLNKGSPESWSCPVSLEPLYPQLVDQVGVDSMHALTLACRLVFTLLNGFSLEGGRLLYEDNSDFASNAYDGLPPPPSHGGAGA